MKISSYQTPYRLYLLGTLYILQGRSLADIISSRRGNIFYLPPAPERGPFFEGYAIIIIFPFYFKLILEL